MMTMIVLAQNDPTNLAGPIRAQVQQIGANVPTFDVRTLETLYQSRAMMSSRLASQILTALGFLALTLAAVGLCRWSRI